MSTIGLLDSNNICDRWNIGMENQFFVFPLDMFACVLYNESVRRRFEVLCHKSFMATPWQQKT